MKSKWRLGKGYILMEVMLASGIFALAGVGLAIALNNIAKTYLQASQLSDIRMELASRLNEARIQPISPGKDREKENSQGVIFTREIVPMQLTHISRAESRTTTKPMNGYYRITVTAAWAEGKVPQYEKAEIYLYQP